MRALLAGLLLLAPSDVRRRMSTPSLVVASLLLAAGLAGCVSDAPADVALEPGNASAPGAPTALPNRIRLSSIASAQAAWTSCCSRVTGR